MTLEERLASVRLRIERAAQKSGRSGSDVTLVAVTKGVSLADVERAYQLGQKDFGENRVQEAREKIGLCDFDANWHMIGHLQTNKARHALQMFSLIHSLDRISLAKELQRQCEREDKVVRTLVQINIAGESTKFGISPEDVSGLVERVKAYDRIYIDGIMTIAPYTDDPESVRPHFAEMARIRDMLSQRSHERLRMRHLSMGMSGDFEVAIEEGATMVRIGTAVFGPRSAAAV